MSYGRSKKKSIFGGFFKSNDNEVNLEDYALSQWTTQMVVSWLKDQGHDKKVYKIFEKNKITGAFFCQNVTKADIIRLGFTPGMSITLHNQIEKLIERMKSINPYNVILSSRPHHPSNTTNNQSSNSIASSSSLSLSSRNSMKYDGAALAQLSGLNGVDPKDSNNVLLTPPRPSLVSKGSTGSIMALTTQTSPLNISQSSPGFSEKDIPMFAHHQRKFSMAIQNQGPLTSTNGEENVFVEPAYSSTGALSIADIEIEDDYFLKMEMESFTVGSKQEEEKELQEFLSEPTVAGENTPSVVDQTPSSPGTNSPTSGNSSPISTTSTSSVANNSSSNNIISSASSPTTNSKYLLVPVAPMEKVPEEYAAAYEFCLTNLRLLPFEVNNIKAVAQDLVIPERFMFKYCNIKHYMPDDDEDETGSERASVVRTMTKTFLKVQFVINATDRGVWFKMQRQYKNQLKGYKPHKFGSFYPALLIGPFLFEYTSHGFALVRISKSKRVVGHEITTITGADKVKELLQKVSQVCCEFNGSRKFDIQKNNPMSFVYAVLDKLKIRKSIENHLGKGCIKAFIQNLEKFGYYSMTLNLPKQLATLLGKEEYIIDSHKDLDELHINIQTNFPEYFDVEGKMDETLLQSFDISFWYLHHENKTVEDFKPAYSGKICKCPFNMLEKHPIDMIESVSKSNYRGAKHHMQNVLPTRPAYGLASVSSSANLTEMGSPTSETKC
ncbi:predicted protein [Naegleria gruberi]|uniref:Predicted protein n=1 Tax=Naegleria gruberi TaxID=5762 RepID=D2VN85_NAEGR|nr:uncharacterized protein NAEGRDRAFT_70406 [Naegleria gruberi]EFC41607.1 predicted protein [Naegleria gruberi]|eukprot:XP_002674351.1 predicted protein [Naegleria gruberi strain NEG-M]